MKKIFLIGKFNLALQGLYKHLSQNHDVQICVDNYDMVKSMLASIKPDLIIVCLIELGLPALGIFGELRNNYSSTKILCIGTKEEQECFTEYLQLDNFNILPRPVSNEKISEIANLLLSYGKNTETADENFTEEVSSAEDGRKNILLVDDNSMQLRTLNELLKDKYNVQMTTSGMKGLELIKRRVPDIIFLDYEMPEFDGKMTLEMIRKMEYAKDIPVVFLTGVQDRQHIAEVLQLKPAAYLLKPANADTIYDTIDKIFKDTP